MSFCVGRHYGRSTGPGLWGQNEKTPQPVSPGARRVCDVFVVGGATAVGYLCRLHSQICAKSCSPGVPDRGQASRLQKLTVFSVGARLARDGARTGAASFQPSNSLMAMICSATWISFCWRLMAWRRIRV
ncbi:hypothetical protein C1Y35_06240 [Pseudomonas sp. GW456-L14]|nr:hypothetical protein C1Y35_06240 [Pseudomonas sp. GW456-L14]